MGPFSPSDTEDKADTKSSQSDSLDKNQIVSYKTTKKCDSTRKENQCIKNCYKNYIDR